MNGTQQGIEDYSQLDPQGIFGSILGGAAGRLIGGLIGGKTGRNVGGIVGKVGGGFLPFPPVQTRLNQRTWSCRASGAC